MAAWSNAAVAAPAPARRSREQGRPSTARPSARPRRQARRLRGGIVWIAALGILLAGIVALNVAVLRLNMRVDKLDRQRTQLRAENAALQSQLASAAAAPRIQAKVVRLGLHQATPQDTRYLRLTPR